MNNRLRLTAALIASLFSALTMAQPAGEASEPSPEELDAAFTEADAVREAAGWSDEIIERGPADPLAEMSAEADLVIRGTVTGQEIVYDANDVPFTHTTLNVDEVLAGDYSDSLVTVVQEGGPLKHKPDDVLILSHTHYFTPGEEEVLFLELNLNSPHPQSRMVIKNRFGVLNGKVFSENGRGLIYTEIDNAPGYKLSWSGDRNPHPRFSEFKVGPHEFSREFRQRGQAGESPGQARSAPGKSARPGYQAGVDIGTFQNALSRKGGKGA